jgi:hypothetical protein
MTALHLAGRDAFRAIAPRSLSAPQAANCSRDDAVDVATHELASKQKISPERNAI